jgi:hypothetical protein
MCALGLVLSTSHKLPCKSESDLIECYILLTFYLFSVLTDFPLRYRQFQLCCMYHVMMNVYCQNMWCVVIHNK